MINEYRYITIYKTINKFKFKSDPIKDNFPFQVKDILSNAQNSHNYLASLPLKINNTNYYFLKKVNVFTNKNINTELKKQLNDISDQNLYSYLYLFNKYINKKNIINMATTKVVFIPVRYNADGTDIGAIISQEQMADYVITSDTFKAIEKKILLDDILKSTLTTSLLLDLPLA